MLIAQASIAASAEAGLFHLTPSMIIASLNGTHGQGFVEFIERGDGSVEKTGVLKLSARHATHLQTCFEANEPLTYAGPVLANGRWRAETLAVLATSIICEPGAPETVSVTLCGLASATVADR